MTIPNKLAWIFSSILKPTTTQSAFILLWAGLAPFSLKYKILKRLTLCLVFLDLSNYSFKYLFNFGGAVQIACGALFRFGCHSVQFCR